MAYYKKISLNGVFVHNSKAKASIRTTEPNLMYFEDIITNSMEKAHCCFFQATGFVFLKLWELNWVELFSYTSMLTSKQPLRRFIFQL